ncbi:hypothetical protein D3C86_1468210 [compost metagenome]
MHAELLLDIFGQRMHLQTKVLPLYRIEEIEADGELGTKTGVNPLTQQRPGLTEHQVLRRDLDPDRTKPEIETVLLRHTVKTPGIVGGRWVEIAHLFHPLTTPHTGVKEGHYPKRLARRLMQCGMQCLPGHQCRLALDIGIEQEVDGR